MKQIEKQKKNLKWQLLVTCLCHNTIIWWLSSSLRGSCSWLWLTWRHCLNRFRCGSGLGFCFANSRRQTIRQRSCMFLLVRGLGQRLLQVKTNQCSKIDILELKWTITQQTYACYLLVSESLPMFWTWISVWLVLGYRWKPSFPGFHTSNTARNIVHIQKPLHHPQHTL